MVECPEVAEGNGLVEALLWLGCRPYRGQAGAAFLVRLGDQAVRRPGAVLRRPEWSRTRARGAPHPRLPTALSRGLHKATSSWFVAVEGRIARGTRVDAAKPAQGRGHAFDYPNRDCSALARLRRIGRAELL